MPRPTTNKSKRTAALPPTAQRLLDASRRIVMRKGYEGLKMSAVGREAGARSSLVHYYFGSKAGLVSALLESLVSDPNVIPREKVDKQPAGWPRIKELLESQRRVSAARDDFRVFYELIPHILRDDVMRERMAVKYEAVRELDSKYLSVAAGEESSLGLAALSIAVLDGLGLQLALDPDGFDHEGAYLLWTSILSDLCATSTGEGANT